MTIWAPSRGMAVLTDANPEKVMITVNRRLFPNTKPEEFTRITPSSQYEPKKRENYALKFNVNSSLLEREKRCASYWPISFERVDEQNYRFKSNLDLDFLKDILLTCEIWNKSPEFVYE